MNTFVHFLNALVVAITGSIVASICGGAGWALIMAGPGGLVIGFIIAAATAVPILFGYRKRVQGFFENNLPVPSFILYRFALTDAKIRVCRNKLKAKLTRKINEHKKKTLTELTEKLGDVIQAEIDRLSIINVM